MQSHKRKLKRRRIVRVGACLVLTTLVLVGLLLSSYLSSKKDPPQVLGVTKVIGTDAGYLGVWNEFAEQKEAQKEIESTQPFIQSDIVGFGKQPITSLEEDPGEFWTHQRRSGMNREKILSQLAYDPAFTAFCKARHIFRQPEYVELVAVGDNLYHQKVIASGRQEDGSYNYDSIYSRMKDYMQDKDIKILNQEICLSDDPAKWTSFPDFACPMECGEAVINAGFNVITLATNHALDKGPQATLDSLAFWHRYEGILTTGVYDSQESHDTIVVGEYSGVKVAFLNYTYGMNGRSVPKDYPYIVNVLDMKQVEADITAAREVADLVIVFPHWGVEYQNTPTPQQRQQAQQMADAGADLIIGSHPHVIQPLEILESKDGKDVPCFYSLGNFVANMTSVEKCIECMAHVTIKRDGKEISIVSVEAVPIVSYISPDSSEYCIYLLEDYTDELGKNHRNTDVTPARCTAIWNQVFTITEFNYETGITKP